PLPPARAARAPARRRPRGGHRRRRRRLAARRSARLDAPLLAGRARRRSRRGLVPARPGAPRMRIASVATHTLRARVSAVDSASAPLLASAGAVVAATALFADRLDWPAANIEFAGNGSFLLYVFLIIGQVAV